MASAFRLTGAHAQMGTDQARLREHREWSFETENDAKLMGSYMQRRDEYA